MRQVNDRPSFIFGALFFVGTSIALSLGHLTSVWGVPSVGPTITMTNDGNLHVPAMGNQCDAALAAAPAGIAEIMAAHNNASLELVDEIINFRTSVGLDQKAKAVGRGATIVGVASTYNPYRPGRHRVASKPPTASDMIPLSGQPQSKLICVRSLAASATASNIGPHMPSLRAPLRRPSLK